MTTQLERRYMRRDTAANWSSVNPVLGSGEEGYDTTNRIVKIGDGSTAWNSLQVENAGLFAGPDLIIPPVAIHYTPAAAAAWPVNDAIIAMRFTVPYTKTYRYANINVGTQSGNIQTCVARLSGASHLDYTRVMNSGVIACPATGNQRVDMTETSLTAGEYALTLWADNTTFTTRHVNAGIGWLRGAMTFTSGTISGGLAASGSFDVFSDRIFSASLEASPLT